MTEREPTGSGPGAGAGRPVERPFPPAPRMLSRRADPAPLPPPVQEADEIASLHVKFARLVGSAQSDAADATGPGSGPGSGSAAPGGVRAKVRARVAAVARADAGADREFMGSVVRAVALLAERVDDLATRTAGVELLLQEMLDRLSEDLVRVQEALGALDDRTAVEHHGADA